MEALEFKTVIEGLCEYYGRKLNEFMIRSWWNALKGYPIDDVRKAADVWTDQSNQFPTKSQFRAVLYDVRKTRESKDGAVPFEKTEPWEDQLTRAVWPFFMKLVRREPGYDTKKFSNDFLAIAKQQGILGKIDPDEWRSLAGDDSPFLPKRG